MIRALVIFTWVLLAISQLAWGVVPRTISYQGILTDNNGVVVADGDYSITFRLYDVAIGGAALWEETQAVTALSGRSDVILGNSVPMDALSFDTQYWLAMKVESDAEMTPRIELAAASYSLNARTVEDGAITAGKIADGTAVRSINNLADDVTLHAGANIMVTQSNDTLYISATGGGGADSDWIIEGDDMHSAVSGNVGIGTTDPKYKLDVAGSVNATTYGIPQISGLGDTVKAVTFTKDTLAFWHDDFGSVRESTMLTRGFLKLQDPLLWGDYSRVSPWSVQVAGHLGELTNVSAGGLSLDGPVSNISMGTMFDAKLTLTGLDHTITFDAGYEVPFDSTVILPPGAITAPEVSDEPGVAGDLSSGSVTLTGGGTRDILLSQTISVPAAGYVMVIGSCQATAYHTLNAESGADFGVSDVTTGFPPNQDIWWYLPGPQPTGTYRVPVTVHGLFLVTAAGDYTFYLLAQETGGDIVAFDMQLSTVYFATNYGTVMPTLVGSGGLPDAQTAAQSPMSRADVAAKRSESVAANAARIEGELAAMERRLSDLKSEMEELRSREKK